MLRVASLPTPDFASAALTAPASLPSGGITSSSVSADARVAPIPKTHMSTANPSRARIDHLLLLIRERIDRALAMNGARLLLWLLGRLDRRRCLLHRLLHAHG